MLWVHRYVLQLKGAVGAVTLGWVRLRLVALVIIRRRGAILIEGACSGLHSPFCVVLDVHVPFGVYLMKALDDVEGEGLVAAHGDEGIAETFVLSTVIVTFDDPKYEFSHLT